MANKRKAKRVTNKEFKEILTACGMDFDVWGYDGVINLLVVAQRSMGDKDEAGGYNTLAKREHEVADKLQDALRERGFYDFN